ncbi:MAG: leucine-rich repeat domain-containing protein, partial [Clostridiales bacterium]|nr:leucine-rich repeat domain-containing protein [Clostridiales bacterium]
MIILEREREREREREDRTSISFLNLTNLPGFLFAKKLCSLIVSIILFTSLSTRGVFFNVETAHAAEDANGTCGDNLIWVFTGATGNLTISGTGDMDEYNGTNMPWYSFKDSITSLTIESGVTSIGACAFYSCSSLTGSLTIPEGVTTINSNAFYSCIGFNGELTLPESLKNIDIAAFINCSGLTGSITIPAGVTNIGSYAFCEIGLTAINVHADNADYASVDGILYNKALTTLIQCP